MKLRKLPVIATASSLLLVTSVGANAALDAAVTTAISNATADITEVGVALIGMAAVAMGLRWVKATFF